MAMIKLESYGPAISDANEAIQLDPTYIKAYYRRGSANFALGKYKDARKDFRSVVKLKPKDQDAKKKLAACEKFIKEDLFLKAIESEQTVPVSQQVHPDDINVEDSYSGPRLAEDGTVTVEFCLQMMEAFKEQKAIHRKYLLQILIAARNFFSQLPSLIRIPLPLLPSTSDDGESSEPKKGHVIVCGDTHGQFYDLCNIFEIGGIPSASNPYVFNGDFVDRGSFSLEVVVTLLAFKLALPEGMNKIYGFEGEVKHKYDTVAMQLFSEVFQWIPLCAVVNDSVFVVHGGLSTINDGCVTLKEIEDLRRDREPPESGLMSDLLWSGE
ncbi:PPP5C [Symbiodinium microadriaticum]|nr:PPP5C [Symbiodinium microadriaticum]